MRLALLLTPDLAEEARAVARDRAAVEQRRSVLAADDTLLQAAQQALSDGS